MTFINGNSSSLFFNASKKQENNAGKSIKENSSGVSIPTKSSNESSDWVTVLSSIDSGVPEKEQQSGEWTTVVSPEKYNQDKLRGRISSEIEPKNKTPKPNIDPSMPFGKIEFPHPPEMPVPAEAKIDASINDVMKHLDEIKLPDQQVGSGINFSSTPADFSMGIKKVKISSGNGSQNGVNNSTTGNASQNEPNTSTTANASQNEPNNPRQRDSSQNIST